MLVSVSDVPQYTSDPLGTKDTRSLNASTVLSTTNAFMFL